MDREKLISLIQFIWPSNREKWCVDGELQKLERFAAAVEANCVPQWISVETSPTPGTYLCLGRGGTMFICHFNRGIWWRQSYANHIVGVTHWMPLPAAPAQKEES